MEACHGGSRWRLATTDHAVAPYDGCLRRRLAAYVGVGCSGGLWIEAMAVGGVCSRGSSLWRQRFTGQHLKALTHGGCLRRWLDAEVGDGLRHGRAAACGGSRRRRLATATPTVAVCGGGSRGEILQCRLMRRGLAVAVN